MNLFTSTINVYRLLIPILALLRRRIIGDAPGDDIARIDVYSDHLSHYLTLSPSSSSLQNLNRAGLGSKDK